MIAPAAARMAIHAGAGRCVRGAATGAFGENPQETGVIRVAAGINVAANRANIGKILAGGLVPRAVSKPGVEKRRKTCAGAG